MRLLPVAKGIWQWLNLPIVFPFVVAVAAFVYLVDRYRAVLRASVVLEYLKALSLPATLVIVAIVATVIFVRNAPTISAAALLVRQRAANRRQMEGMLVINTTLRRFLLVGDLYKRLHEQHCISNEDYDKWAIFAQHFKSASAEVVEAWRLAEYASDKSLSSLEVGLTTLTGPLTKFEASALASLQPK